jgi:hypothetical protein
MKALAVLTLLLFASLLPVPSSQLAAQGPANYHIALEEIIVPGMPALQSFVSGEAGGKWILMGGRTDGLHRRQPWASFWSSENNMQVYVFDPVTKNIWAQSLDSLSASLKDQLQSTNMEFEQVGDMLYICGGYGYSALSQGYNTHSGLVAVNVTAAINAIMNGTNMSGAFRQISDSRVKITGGYLDYLDGKFYLVGGQDFVGQYNPMGPNNGPGFFQAYSNQIRSFRIVDNGTSLSIADYNAITDTLQLHRRDYNLVPQILPGNVQGFTAFSGVFQYGADLPWLNTVDITATGYYPNSVFNQYLNQYHTANMPIYDSASSTMYSIFFGGIGRYSLDGNGNLVDDQRVPFVKTISMVSRDSSGAMLETGIGLMPDYLGAGAEFIRDPGLAIYPNEVIKLSHLSSDSNFVGYIYGGIESSLPNIFFINTGVESVSSNRIFKVFLVKGQASGLRPGKVDDKAYFNLKISPNPVSRHLKIQFQMLKDDHITLRILDNQGRLLDILMDEQVLQGKHEIDYEVGSLAGGVYTLVLSNKEFSSQQKFVKK